MDFARSDRDGKSHFQENETSGSTADSRRSGSSRPIVEFTILRGAGGDKYPLRKEYFLQDGKPAKRGFANPARFHATTAPVPSHAQLGALLDHLESSKPDCCVIRGRKSRLYPQDGGPVYRLLHPGRYYIPMSGTKHLDGGGERIDPTGKQLKDLLKRGDARWVHEDGERWLHYKGERWVRVKLLEMFDEGDGSRILVLDIDKLDLAKLGAPKHLVQDWRSDLEGTVRFFRDVFLPPEFHGRWCWAAATASAADLSRDDLGGSVVNLHLVFVASRPITYREGVAWLGKTGLDTATLRPIQVTYTARPGFRDGLVDPMPRRTVTLDGAPFVVVPEGLKPASKHRCKNAERRRTADIDDMLEGFGAEGVGLYPCPAFDKLDFGHFGLAGSPSGMDPEGRLGGDVVECLVERHGGDTERA
jgi:hypothetical protein